MLFDLLSLWLGTCGAVINEYIILYCHLGIQTPQTPLQQSPSWAVSTWARALGRATWMPRTSWSPPVPSCATLRCTRSTMALERWCRRCSNWLEWTGGGHDTSSKALLNTLHFYLFAVVDVHYVVCFIEVKSQRINSYAILFESEIRVSCKSIQQQ